MGAFAAPGTAAAPIAAAVTGEAATVTKSFSLTREDVAIIEAVRREEGLLSDSAALRRLIRDAQSLRVARMPVGTGPSSLTD